MNQNKLIGILLVLIGSIFSASAQCDGRYESKTFSNVDVSSNVVYGWNTRSSGVMDTLKMDIYTPAGDTVANRPVVILAHGGSFINGNKNLPDMIAFCNGLARRGYVAISIGYRLENPLALSDPTSAEEAMVKAVMRAVQDGRAAIRYIRKSFVELGDPYKVDTANIHIGGSSAGGILAMQVAFMDDESKLKAEWKPYVTELGGLEGNDSGSPGYSSRVSSVISLAGAIADTTYITQENLIPVFSSHSEGDNTVKYGHGYPLGLDYLPILFGSGALQSRMENQCGISWFDSHTGGEHPPYMSGNAGVEETDSLIGAFLYRMQDCYPGTTLSQQQADQQANCKTTAIQGIEANSSKINIYPNPSNGLINVRVSEAIDNGKVEIYNAIGQLISAERLNGNQIEMNLSDWNKGMYILRISVENNTSALSKKLILN